jgi:hypothetical protein
MDRCACNESSCMCTTLIPNDGQALCQYCRTFGHQERKS